MKEHGMGWRRPEPFHHLDPQSVEGAALCGQRQTAANAGRILEHDVFVRIANTRCPECLPKCGYPGKP